MHQIKVILSEIHYGKEPSGKIDFVLIYSFVSFVLLTRIFLSTSYPTPFVFLSQRMYRVASKCPVVQCISTTESQSDTFSARWRQENLVLGLISKVSGLVLCVGSRAGNEGSRRFYNQRKGSF